MRADAETAESILRYVREHLAPYKRVRRLEFGELPKTISGKIRRVELRTAEHERDGPGRERVPRGGLPGPQGLNPQVRGLRRPRRA